MLPESAQKKKHSEKHAIYVYTEDFRDKEDIMRVEKALRKLNIDGFLQYTADIYTSLNMYKSNDHGIKPCFYSSEILYCEDDKQIETRRLFDHKEPLQHFLKRNKPSEITQEEVHWIYVAKKEFYEINHCCTTLEHQKILKEMMKEWESLLENQATTKITPQMIRELALKYRILNGKWLIFANQ